MLQCHQDFQQGEIFERAVAVQLVDDSDTESAGSTDEVSHPRQCLQTDVNCASSIVSEFVLGFARFKRRMECEGAKTYDLSFE
jgi:hypothetical protein